MNEISNGYLKIDKTKNKQGDDITKQMENLGDIIIKQYSGIDSENFIIKKNNGKNISFSLFKLNGIYYVNINGEHILDYIKFTKISKISNIQNDSIEITNTFIDKLIIHNCDVQIFKKALDIMNKYMKKHKTYINDLLYILFN